MATSESDDFESADEEMNHDISARRNNQTRIWSPPTAIDSESDDDTEFVPRAPYDYRNIVYSEESKKCSSKTDYTTNKNTIDEVAIQKSEDDNVKSAFNKEKGGQLVNTIERTENECSLFNLQTEECVRDSNTMTLKVDKNDEGNSVDEITAHGSSINNPQVNADNITTNIDKENVVTTENPDASTSSVQDELSELSELEMPEEMKSDKTFKEVFKPEGWEGLGNEIELPEELTEEKLQPILKKLSLAGQEMQTSYSGWGWDNWGVSTLINTATVGVSAITNHVSHGLTLLEESIAVTEEPENNETENKENSVVAADKPEEEPQQYSSFGFGNFLSGVSSITKLVETTGSKVMSGGLDTLEAIGKKTMEVLQEGDPGLKKKRAIFINESEKPNLSQVLREAKEKADTTERTIEEKQKMRKIHFESLFDDYQGLVHLEALEMLSKQSNIKIQEHLIGLNATELTSVQETLQDVLELCNVGEDDDENEKDDDINNLKFRLQEISNDLGVNITYEKIHTVCQESEVYLAPPVTHTEEEIFEKSISVLAQFTAFSVERFHKTAELLLIKEHRSTVNEADALVQLTRVLCNQIGILANAYYNSLNTLSKLKETPNSIKASVTTTIFMEASNASSYIQDAFKLLTPIIQVGAI
ncbi:protein FAM114A2 [Lasioglossum baleicum]|uniref:protein FAM114A2 n=1 Tax=Lasioglossum baleicum TaxID=434251 RepID=UPI003FCCAC36